MIGFLIGQREPVPPYPALFTDLFQLNYRFVRFIRSAAQTMYSVSLLEGVRSFVRPQVYRINNGLKLARLMSQQSISRRLLFASFGAEIKLPLAESGCRILEIECYTGTM
ncbi:hypothetical protein GWI33_003864 [Rhynchophorus ferrugineus]|uniref:Uncharacterized protein n=1 Tax=Rhynchophorus ferrugineus TaxID=354439 RepID=A0A834HW63_RHYFE|nr:hypothetical protein GWI33_003864 [Rhynchophorus ferrugineus]